MQLKENMFVIVPVGLSLETSYRVASVYEWTLINAVGLYRTRNEIILKYKQTLVLYVYFSKAIDPSV